ncbi:MAG: glutathione S-transferase family protein, partial [Myxococcota bacterium]
MSEAHETMITLYHLPFSRSLRVRWLLEELELPYELVTRSFGDLKQPEHLALHPLGKVPVLRDGDVVLFESGAILQHLLERYGEGRLEPKPGTPERSRYWQWFHFAEATVTPPLGLVVQHGSRLPEAERSPEALAFGLRSLRQALDVVETALAGQTWLLPEFSAADVMMGYSVKLTSLVGQLGGGLPSLREYLA